MSVNAVVISIGSGAISILLMIIGFFLRQLYSEIKSQGVVQIEFNNKLISNAKDLVTVQALCGEKHKIIHDDHTDHEKRIRSNEKDIEHIKVKVNIE
jgi:hypothetical protein